MTYRFFLPLALFAFAHPAVAQSTKGAPKATAVQPAPKTEKPLTEADLMKTLENFRVGDPTKAQPLSAEPEPLTEAGLPTLRPGEKPGGSSDSAAATAAARANNQTEITAREATFEQKTHQAVFQQEVVVINPEFKVTTDKLTVYMRQGENAAGEAKAPATANAQSGKAGAGKARKTGPGNGGGAGKSSGGLERAIAEGNVVITQDKVDADGNVSRSVGYARKAVYEAGTGDITLSGRPSVGQGINTLEATDDTTLIILNREGRMRAIGPHKSIIRDTGSESNNPLASPGKNKTTSTSTNSTNAR